MNNLVCDKCKKPVTKENDATIWEAYVTGEFSAILVRVPRHLYPTEDCEGSPSRVRSIKQGGKYLEAYNKLRGEVE